jgi:small subunit ribosomal protein S9
MAKKATPQKPTTAKKPEVQAAPAKSLGTYFYAYGRRKTATATVRLFKAKGESFINEKAAKELYPLEYEQIQLNSPLVAAGLKPEDYHFTVQAKGSGKTGQLGAIKLVLARAIVVMDPTLKQQLKKEGLLTRDPRMVERKKPGLRKARRAEQFSKR